MIIRNILSPKVAGEHSAEEIIFRRGIGDLYTELREVLLQTQVLITDTPRRGNTTQIQRLADSMNQAIKESLKSLGWGPLPAPGAAQPRSTIDWSKVRPSGLDWMGDIGLAVEVQFGHHYQFNADVQRIAEAILGGKIIAGISIVASDRFANYKSDRGASFSNAREKLERWLSIWAASGAILLPSIMILGVEFDGFIDQPAPGFSIKYPLFDLGTTKGKLEAVSWGSLH